MVALGRTQTTRGAWDGQATKTRAVQAWDMQVTGDTVQSVQAWDMQMTSDTVQSVTVTHLVGVFKEAANLAGSQSTHTQAATAGWHHHHHPLFAHLSPPPHM